MPDGGGRHAAPQRKFVEQRRDEQQRHEQRDGEVDDDYQRKVGQVGLLFLGKQPDDAQRPDRGEQRPEDRDENPAVAVIAVMVDHDDRRVDDDAERDRDARQRVDVNVQPEQVVEDHGDQDVHHERHQDDEQVAQVAADQEDEQQQDRHAQQRPDVYFIQLSGDVAGGVVVERRGDFGRKTRLQALHLRADRRGDAQHVRMAFAGDREVDGVQPVDPEIACRQSLAPAHRCEIAQVIDPAVPVRHGDLPEVGRRPVAQFQHDAAPGAVGLRERRESDHFAAEVIPEGGGEVRSRDSDRLHGLGVERDHPFERRDARKGDLADPFDPRKRRRNVVRDILLDAFGRKVGLDGVDQRLGFPAARCGERDVGIADLLGQFCVEVADRRGHLEACRRHVRALAEPHRDAAPPLRRTRRDAFAARDGRKRAFDARRGALLDQACRCVGPGEGDVDLPLGDRRRVLDVEHRKHRHADNRQRRHDQQHRKGGNTAPRGGYVPRIVHRRGL